MIVVDLAIGEERRVGLKYVVFVKFYRVAIVAGEIRRDATGRCDAGTTKVVVLHKCTRFSMLGVCQRPGSRGRKFDRRGPCAHVTVSVSGDSPAGDFSQLKRSTHRMGNEI